MVDCELLCARCLALMANASDPSSRPIPSLIDEVAAKQGVSIRVQSQLNTMPKHARISMLEPHINSGRIRLSRRHAELLAQLRQFPLGRHDDGPDALATAFDATRSERRPRVYVSNRN